MCVSGLNSSLTASLSPKYIYFFASQTSVLIHNYQLPSLPHSHIHMQNAGISSISRCSLLCKYQSHLSVCLNQRPGRISESSFSPSPTPPTFNQSIRKPYWHYWQYPDSVYFSLHNLHSSPSHHHLSQEDCDNFSASVSLAKIQSLGSIQNCLWSVQISSSHFLI